MCLDTNTLVYAVSEPGEGNTFQSEARGALERLSAARATVAIPSLCICEYLAGVPETDRAGIDATFTRRFRTLDFTPTCWPLAARILASKSQLREAQAVPGATRQSVRVDSFILAIVGANGGTLVTRDEGLTKLAVSMGIPVLAPADVLPPAAG